MGGMGRMGRMGRTRWLLSVTKSPLLVELVRGADLRFVENVKLQ